MQDSFGREITYARLSVTDLCNLRCRYCMPEGVEKKAHAAILTLEELTAISEALAELGVYKQRITGGEPLVRRGIMTLIEAIGANKNVKQLAITTNGQLLSGLADDLYKAGVRGLNVSLDTLNAAKYEQLTKGGNIANAIDGIAAARAAGFQGIKLNAVLLRGVNDDEIYSLATYAKSINARMRFIELMPFASQYNYAKDYFISTKEVVKCLNLQIIDKASVDKKVAVYRFEDGVEADFISPLSNRFCSECNRIRVSADGKLLNCLHECVEYDLRPYLADKAALKTYIEACVKLKPREHRLSEGVLQSRPMEDIGG